MNPVSAPDLTARPPRSPRVRLGNIAALPRILDKCRAVIAGTNGEYDFNCGLDQRVFTFLGVDAEAFRAEVAQGKGDFAMLQWVLENGAARRSELEFAQWSEWMDRRGPSSDQETSGFFLNAVHQIDPERDDITTWFAWLDLDDYVSFGGRP